MSRIKWPLPVSLGNIRIFLVLYQELGGSARFVLCFFFSLWIVFYANHCKWRRSSFISNRWQTVNKNCAQYLVRELSSLGQDLLKTCQVFAKTCSRLVKSVPQLAQDMSSLSQDSIQDLPRTMT